MLRPTRGGPMEEMREDYGAFFEQQEFIVTDFSNFKI